MTHEDLFKLHHELCEAAFGIMQKKNADYSAGDKADPFKNFQGSKAFGVEPEIGAMIRMQDKFMRVMAFIVNGTLAVNDEGLMDIGHDLINYTVLLIGMAKDRAETNVRSSLSIDGPNVFANQEIMQHFRPRSYPIPEGWVMLPDGAVIYYTDRVWVKDKFVDVGQGDGTIAGTLITKELRASGALSCVIRQVKENNER